VHDVLAPQGWRCERSERVANAFYTSQAMRLVRA
jgi:hypothetical protein